MNDDREGRWLLSRLAVGDRASRVAAYEFGLNLRDESVDHSPLLQTFVFSLSTESDLLSQWRAYASGGRGVAIGFDLSEMSNVACWRDWLKQENKTVFAPGREPVRVDADGLSLADLANGWQNEVGLGQLIRRHPHHIDGVRAVLHHGVAVTRRRDGEVARRHGEVELVSTREPVDRDGLRVRIADHKHRRYRHRWSASDPVQAQRRSCRPPDRR